MKTSIRKFIDISRYRRITYASYKLSDGNIKDIIWIDIAGRQSTN